MADSRVTILLKAWSEGDPVALASLTELAYPELRGIAKRYFLRERADHTLQCTALVNEAYMRLVSGPPKDWKNRAHFFGFAAHLMRGILVDYARARRTAKRGSGAVAVAITEAQLSAEPPPLDVIDLHSALEALEKLDPRQSRMVELRYFGGLSIEETAEIMGVSISSVKRDWILARTWIRRRLLEGSTEETETE